jgi:hypothetical protein
VPVAAHHEPVRAAGVGDQHVTGRPQLHTGADHGHLGTAGHDVFHGGRDGLLHVGADLLGAGPRDVLQALPVVGDRVAREHLHLAADTGRLVDRCGERRPGARGGVEAGDHARWLRRRVRIVDHEHRARRVAEAVQRHRPEQHAAHAAAAARADHQQVGAVGSGDQHRRGVPLDPDDADVDAVDARRAGRRAAQHLVDDLPAPLLRGRADRRHLLRDVGDPARPDGDRRVGDDDVELRAARRGVDQRRGEGEPRLGRVVHADDEAWPELGLRTGSRRGRGTGRRRRTTDLFLAATGEVVLDGRRITRPPARRYVVPRVPFGGALLVLRELDGLPPGWSRHDSPFRR